MFPPPIFCLHFIQVFRTREISMEIRSLDTPGPYYNRQQGPLFHSIVNSLSTLLLHTLPLPNKRKHRQWGLSPEIRFRLIVRHAWGERWNVPTFKFWASEMPPCWCYRQFTLRQGWETRDPMDFPMWHFYNWIAKTVIDYKKHRYRDKF